MSQENNSLDFNLELIEVVNQNSSAIVKRLQRVRYRSRPYITWLDRTFHFILEAVLTSDTSFQLQTELLLEQNNLGQALELTARLLVRTELAPLLILKSKFRNRQETKSQLQKADLRLWCMEVWNRLLAQYRDSLTPELSLSELNEEEERIKIGFKSWQNMFEAKLKKDERKYKKLDAHLESASPSERSKIFWKHDKHRADLWLLKIKDQKLILTQYNDIGTQLEDQIFQVIHRLTSDQLRQSQTRWYESFQTLLQGMISDQEQKRYELLQELEALNFEMEQVDQEIDLIFNSEEDIS